MKKFVIILVLFSYAVSVTGLTVSSFYCCGKLKSTKIVFASSHSHKRCAAKMDSKKCCRYNDSFVKVNDNHFASMLEFAPDAPVAEVVYFDVYSFLQKKLSSSVSYYSNTPPPFFSPPQYLLNCNFRI